MKIYIASIILLISTIIYGKEIEYKVKSGDSLRKIANMYVSQSKHIYVDTFVAEIKEYNSIKKFIKPKMILKIPVLDSPLTTTKLNRDKDFKAKALYIPISSLAHSSFLDKLEIYKKAGINTIVFDVKTMSGEISIPFSHEWVKKIRKNWSSLGDLNKVIYYLHKNDMHAVARVVCFHDESLANGMPNLRLYSKGAYSSWVNPANTEVQTYLLDLIKKLSKYPLDEIQLDYIRFPEAGASECKAQNRVEVINNFLKKVHEITKKEDILLSIDVFGITLWQRKSDVCVTGQDLTKMAKNSDIISPMIYPSHFSNPFDNLKNPGDNASQMIQKSMIRTKEIFDGFDIVIRPYLQAFEYGIKNRKYDYKYIQEQIDEVEPYGWIFWNPRGKYAPVLEASYKEKKKSEKKEAEKELENVMDKITE
ncbi:LysM peptidoglycan-binding domain-containing protein [bacterium]|nr:LysM peptidoglycan-binding domain-containing protein [bacterium]